jgi:hypothetical protein
MQLHRHSLSPAEACSLAADAYIFLYPLMFMEAFRQAWAEKPNTFARLTPLLVRSLDGPPHGLSLTYSLGAWIDLSSGPVLVTLPDPDNRHVIATVFDAWGEILSSIGSRHDGGKGGSYVFVGPAHHYDLQNLNDLAPIPASTSRVWISISIIGRSDTDLDALRSLASKCRATVLGETPLANPRSHRLGSGLSPVARVTSMADDRFFATAAALLEHNPIRSDDLAFTDALERLGLRPGHPFSLSTLGPEMAQFIQEGVATGRAKILSEYNRLSRRMRESWVPETAPEPRHSYLHRAARIRMAPHTAQPEDHLLIATSRDSAGEVLQGTRRYSIRFEPGELPPANALWALSAIDLAGRLITRKSGRSMGSHRPLHYKSDGSLEIHVESTRSRRTAPNINWLQCPQGKFSLILELFCPHYDVLKGAWLPPLVHCEPERRGRPATTSTSSTQVVWLRPPEGRESFGVKVRTNT